MHRGYDLVVRTLGRRRILLDLAGQDPAEDYSATD
jgi:hypothetical protein